MTPYPLLAEIREKTREYFYPKYKECPETVEAYAELYAEIGKYTGGILVKVDEMQGDLDEDGRILLSHALGALYILQNRVQTKHNNLCPLRSGNYIY